MTDEAGKLTLRRLEAPIQKFLKVVVPTDLERLRQHQHNIEKFQRGAEWEKLHQEHINASRTVQQLRSNLREMDKLCGHVRSADATALQKLVQPIQDRASAAAQNFLQLHSSSVNHPGPRPQQTISTNTQSASDTPNSDGEVGGARMPVTQSQLFLPAIPPDQNAAESWDSLEEDLLQLNGLVNEFSSLVHAQQDKIDSIEANVSIAAANVEEGTRSLGKTAQASLLVLPVAGAVVGTVLGGPLGLLAGYKVAGLAAALGGALLGFTGGNLIQRRKRERVEHQLLQLQDTDHGHEPTQ
ncbi:syntaxin-17 [Electrophorus electricus]|uniref:t-SNARE coiled-coil homology domain-containing protein n=1 Tax=Electrophorus electricus TaxID=8005 RepID=A0A4W4GRB9_ELEEL|nr:syntaxin-17 [Electrophorus electricus]XP_035381970.1 syntaxin-17 [Electrophorus electricus]